MTILRVNSILNPDTPNSEEPRAPLTITHVEAIHTRDTAGAVIEASPRSEEGRSQWLRFVLSSGDIVFGCYPQGETLILVGDNPSR